MLVNPKSERPEQDQRVESKVASVLLNGFINVLYVTSAIFVIWAVVVMFFPAKSMPLLLVGILVIAATLYGTARMARQQGRIETWMRWVPSLVVMPVFVVSVYNNHTYALTSITVVLALHALFLPKLAGRWMMALTIGVALLPFATSESIDLKLWVRLMFAALLGLVLFDFAGRRILMLAKWLEESQVELTEQNRELAAAKVDIEKHRDHLEGLVHERTAELEATNASLGLAKSELEGMNLRLERLVSERTEELLQTNQKLSDAVRQLEKLAETDGLTGLYCRRRFMELAKSEVLRSLRYGAALSLIMLDLDHFKSINDRFGHHAGDVALTALAAYLDNTKRANDIIGRLGGEEFAILLPETTLEDARVVAERIRSGIAAISLNDSGNSFGMTASIGIVQLKSDSLDELMSRADGFMYQAKAQGRNRIVTS